MTEDLRIPPHDLDAERAVLASVIIDSDRFEAVRALINDRDFYREIHAQVFAAFEDIYLSGGSIDQLTVANQLQRAHKLTPQEISDHLRTMVAQVPTSVHAEHYARIVRRAGAMRRAITGAKEVIDAAYGEPDEDVLADQIMTIGLDVGGRKTEQRRLVSFAEIFDRKQTDIIELFAKSREQRGISTGLTDFDTAVGGLHRGQLGIVAARANMGKSWWAVTVAKNVARTSRRDEEGRPTGEPLEVAVFSLEMSQQEIYRRAAAGDLGLDFDGMDDRERQDAYGDMFNALADIAQIPLYVSESPRISVDEIRAQSVMRKARGKLDLVLVDYLQLLSPPTMGRGQRMSSVEALEHITRELKILARELDVPVVVLCQLNRAVDARGRRKERSGFRPTLTDLRGSGSIEQDADWVVFLYRHDYYVERGEVEADLARADRLEYVVGKVREGAIRGGLMSYFDPSKSRLEDVGDDNDRPGR